MTPDEAGWVRANAWTEQMRRQPLCRADGSATYDHADALATCECQTGTCFPCTDGRHQHCRAKHPMRLDPEWTLGNWPHPTLPVWIKGRTCQSLCPCPCPRVMSPSEAAWIRNNAWTAGMRRQFADSPGYVLRCACQGGRSSWCAVDRCDGCQPPDPAPTWETLICDRTGLFPVLFAEPFEHPTPSLTGPHHQRLPMVWLADRMCRWACACHCHQQDAPIPEPARAVPAPRPTYELVPLFDLAEVGT